MKYSSVWRTVSGWCLGILFTIVMLPPGLIAFFLDPVKQRLVQPMIRFWARCLMRFCFVDIIVLGRENALKVDSAVFVSNHQSMLDIFMLVGYIPKPAGFLAKKQVIWVPVIGILLLIFGHILVDRSNPRRSLQSVQRCIKALKSGWSIVIFPEGTRTSDGEIQTFKSGGMKIPLRTGAPVVPTTICGNFNVMQKKTFQINPHQIVLHFGEPVPSKEVEVKDFKKFVKEVEEIIRENKKRLETEYPESAPLKK